MIDQNYSNQNVLITGAASGIGLEQLKLYLEAGANVFAIDRQNIPIEHAQLTSYKLDITDHQKLSEVAAAIVQQVSHIDILLNTAGKLDDYTPSLETSYASWQDMIATNLTPMFILSNSVLPSMLANGYGHIINMSSIAGLVAGGGGAAYTMTKHAIAGYTKQLTYDYAHKGIHANAIAPGAIQTPMNHKDFENGGEMAKQVADETPAGRWAKPEEVAHLTLFLTSPQADYINGSVVPIDGGWTVK